MENFDVVFPELSDLHVVDEAHDLTQGTVDVRGIGADLANAEYGALPQVVCITFGDGHVEGVRHPRFDSLDNTAFAF